MTKQEIREQYKAIRAAIPGAARAAKSESMCRLFLASEDYAAADCIFAFLPFGAEIDTQSILADAWARGKRVAVPVTKAGGQMDFVALGGINGLVISKFGVPEPREGAIVLPGAETLMLVPGVAFGRDGFRVGYGKGFYDRYLARVMEETPRFPRIGIGFYEQITDSVPHDDYDIALDRLLTDNGWEELQ